MSFPSDAAASCTHRSQRMSSHQCDANITSEHGTTCLQHEDVSVQHLNSLSPLRPAMLAYEISLFLSLFNYYWFATLHYQTFTQFYIDWSKIGFYMKHKRNLVISEHVLHQWTSFTNDSPAHQQSLTSRGRYVRNVFPWSRLDCAYSQWAWDTLVLWNCCDRLWTTS